LERSRQIPLLDEYRFDSFANARQQRGGIAFYNLAADPGPTESLLSTMRFCRHLRCRWNLVLGLCTAALFLGGVIGTVAICVKQELLLPIVAGVFVVETLSVIVQMASYKLRGGKRVFRMAPLHHHFEEGGIAEPKVTVRFWIVAIILAVITLMTLKIR